MSKQKTNAEAGGVSIFGRWENVPGFRRSLGLVQKSGSNIRCRDITFSLYSNNAIKIYDQLPGALYGDKLISPYGVYNTNTETLLGSPEKKQFGISGSWPPPPYAVVQDPYQTEDAKNNKLVRNKHIISAYNGIPLRQIGLRNNLDNTNVMYKAGDKEKNCEPQVILGGHQVIDVIRIPALAPNDNRFGATGDGWATLTYKRTGCTWNEVGYHEFELKDQDGWASQFKIPDMEDRYAQMAPLWEFGSSSAVTYIDEHGQYVLALGIFLANTLAESGSEGTKQNSGSVWIYKFLINGKNRNRAHLSKGGFGQGEWGCDKKVFEILDRDDQKAGIPYVMLAVDPHESDPSRQALNMYVLQASVHNEWVETENPWIKDRLQVAGEFKFPAFKQIVGSYRRKHVEDLGCVTKEKQNYRSGDTTRTGNWNIVGMILSAPPALNATELKESKFKLEIDNVFKSSLSNITTIKQETHEQSDYGISMSIPNLPITIGGSFSSTLDVEWNEANGWTLEETLTAKRPVEEIMTNMILGNKIETQYGYLNKCSGNQISQIVRYADDNSGKTPVLSYITSGPSTTSLIQESMTSYTTCPGYKAGTDIALPLTKGMVPYSPISSNKQYVTYLNTLAALAHKKDILILNQNDLTIDNLESDVLSLTIKNDITNEMSFNNSKTTSMSVSIDVDLNAPISSALNGMANGVVGIANATGQSTPTNPNSPEAISKKIAESIVKKGGGQEAAIESASELELENPEQSKQPMVDFTDSITVEGLEKSGSTTISTSMDRSFNVSDDKSNQQGWKVGYSNSASSNLTNMTLKARVYWIDVPWLKRQYGVRSPLSNGGVDLTFIPDFMWERNSKYWLFAYCNWVCEKDGRWEPVTNDADNSIGVFATSEEETN